MYPNVVVLCFLQSFPAHSQLQTYFVVKWKHARLVNI